MEPLPRHKVPEGYQLEPELCAMPQCGGSLINLVEQAGDQSACRECGVRGPRAKGTPEAQAKWNKMMKLLSKGKERTDADPSTEAR